MIDRFFYELVYASRNGDISLVGLYSENFDFSFSLKLA